MLKVDHITKDWKEAGSFPAQLFERRVWEIERRPPASSRVRDAVDMLRSASRPFIIAGGGVHYSEAWDELAEFAQRFGVPVGETSAGKGAMRDSRRSMEEIFGMRRMWASCYRAGGKRIYLFGGIATRRES